MTKPRIILATAGGPNTTAQMAWLAQSGAADIVTMTLDVGQGGVLAHVREQVLAHGALRAHVLDVRDEFAREYVLRALRAGARSHGGRPLCVELTWPLVASHLVRVAEMEGAVTVAVGAADASHQALGRSLGELNRALTLVELPRAAELEAFGRERGIPVVARPDRHATASLWGRLFQGADVENTWTTPADDGYTLTKPATRGSETPAFLEVGFERGVPARVNGVPMGFSELTSSVAIIAGSHGVGRFDVLDRRGDTPVRSVGEAPAAIVLHLAHDDLQAFVTPGDLHGITRHLSEAYGALVCDGGWFGASRPALDAFFAQLQERVTGTVRLRLFKGTCAVVGRQSSFVPPAVSPVAGI